MDQVMMDQIQMILNMMMTMTLFQMRKKNQTIFYILMKIFTMIKIGKQILMV